MTKKPIIDIEMYELLLEAVQAVETARDNARRTVSDLEILLEDIDDKLSEYDTTEE
jgi:hypothetical protein